MKHINKQKEIKLNKQLLGGILPRILENDFQFVPLMSLLYCFS